jgi:cysteine desulfurase/selenocysteine lyase
VRKISLFIKRLQKMTKKSDLIAQFPIFKHIAATSGKKLIYLDNAATTQRPLATINAMDDYYLHYNSGVHRGLYSIAEEATKAYEEAREKIRAFINASTAPEIVFTRNTTESINLVATSYGNKHIKNGDEIIISAMEHHSNIVPWQMLAERTGAILRVININDAGEIIMDDYASLLSERTKLVALTHVSNVLGTINPIKQMIAMAHKYNNIPVLIDGAQAIPHMPVDVKDLDCDFYAFSGHKLYGPTGIGVLYAKLPLLQDMPPYQGGGGMIRTVSFNKTEYADTPQKFEAGTPHIAGAIGLGAAISFLQEIGMQNIADHEQQLLNYATPKIQEIAGIKIIGIAKQKVGVISFVFPDIHPHDIAAILADAGIAVRAGHHCAMPLMEFFKVPATARASFGIYNTEEDIDLLIEGLHKVKKFFGVA